MRNGSLTPRCIAFLPGGDYGAGSGDHDDGTARVAGQPAGDRTRYLVPAVAGSADDQSVRAEMISHRSELASRVAAPGNHAHLDALPVAYLVQLREQPAFGFGPGPGQPNYLAGQRLAVDARGDVNHQQRPGEPPGHASGVGQRVTARRRPVVPGYDRMVDVAAGPPVTLRLLTWVLPLWFPRLGREWRRLCLIHGLSSLSGPWSAHFGAPATLPGTLRQL